jgi:GDPmannose 4,6-dehydratase
MKKAIITGIRGQDGAYLARLLLDKGYEVYGADRRSSDQVNWRLRAVGVQDDIKFVYMDVTDVNSVNRAIQDIQPDELYNLAGQSFVGASYTIPYTTSQVNAIGVLNVLEAVRCYSPHTRMYQASTSEMFGNGVYTMLNEESIFMPVSPYAISKLYAHEMVRCYREAYNLKCCSGILFNHESPLRGEEFVTRKIIKGVASISRGEQDKLILGNLDTGRDWGYAKEYVQVMRLMLIDVERNEDYIIATGKTYKIWQFVGMAFKEVGIDIVFNGTGIKTKGYYEDKLLVECSKEFYRPTEVYSLCGDASKAKVLLGWEAKTGLEELIAIMIEAELKRKDS